MDQVNQKFKALAVWLYLAGVDDTKIKTVLKMTHTSKNLVKYFNNLEVYFLQGYMVLAHVVMSDLKFPLEELAHSLTKTQNMLQTMTYIVIQTRKNFKIVQ